MASSSVEKINEIEEEQFILFKKIKKYEIEMLNDRGYKIKFDHFIRYYKITKNFSWYIRLLFNINNENILKNIQIMKTENNFIYYDEVNKVIIDKKGIVICYEQSSNELKNPVNKETLYLDDIDTEISIQENILKQKKSLKINTGLFVDTLVIFSSIENIDKEKIKNLNLEINNYVKFLKPTDKKNVYEFDIENKNLNLMIISPDTLTTPSELFTDIYHIFKNIEYFKYSELKFNVSKHVLVPKHKLMNNEEVSKFIQDMKINPTNVSKELPLLKKDDRIARHYLFVKSNIIKIKRPSFIFPNQYTNYYRYVI